MKPVFRPACTGVSNNVEGGGIGLGILGGSGNPVQTLRFAKRLHLKSLDARGP